MTLPEGWDQSTLGEASEAIQYGLTCTSSAQGDGYRYIRITDIQDRMIDWDAVPFADAPLHKAVPYRVKSGDLLFARTGATVGKSYLIKEIPVPAAFASYLIRVRCHDQLILPQFAAWYFQSPGYWEQILDGAEGTGQPNFNGTKLATLALNLPPITEQRRIVAKLDVLTARLARARAELDRVAVLAEDIRKRSVDLAFARLARCRLGDVAQSIRYGYTDSAKPEGPGSKFLRITDIQNRKVDWSNVPYVDVGPSDLARCALQTGDIVFARSGATVGKSFLIDEPPENAVFASYLIRVRLHHDRLLPAAAAYFFQSADYWAQIEAGATGTGQPNFNGSKLADLSVPFGDVKAQKTAITRIDHAFARADRLEAEAARARKLIDRLESAILARAFRGELVPQDPDDEPASVLLDRIREAREAGRAAAAKPKRGRRVAGNFEKSGA